MTNKLLIFFAVVMLLFVAGSCDALIPVKDDPGSGSQNEGGSADLIVENLGRGYNIFGNYADYRNIKSPILDTSALQSDQRIDRISVETGTFQIYTGTTVTEYSSGMASHAGVSGSDRVFSGSIETNFSRESYSSGKYSYATLQNQIYKEQLSISSTDTQELQEYLLPQAEEDINNPEISPETLFDTYGTHLICSFYAGGRLDFNMAFDMSLITDRPSPQRLSRMVSSSFDAKFVSAGIEYDDVSNEERVQFESHSRQTMNVYGGSSELNQNINNDNDYTSWIQTVADNPKLAGFPKDQERDCRGLTGIWNMAADPDRANEISDVFNRMASGLDIEVDNSVTVEITHEIIRLTANDDAGGNAELYGYSRYALYRYGVGLDAHGALLWNLNEDQADSLGVITRSSPLRINETSIRTFNNFDEGVSFVRIWGTMTEDDDFSEDDPMGYERSTDVFIWEGWNGAREHKLYFQNGGQKAEMIFTIQVVE